jgi:hypothetical protein
VNTKMDALVEAIQDVVVAEQETATQPDLAQPVDTIIETQLTEEISALWSDHLRLSADRKATAKDLRQVRAILAERLHAMKSLLSRPGRGGEWRGWLRQQAIPRSTADRLVSRHAETLGERNVPSGAISEPGDANAEKLAKDVWLRIRKFLTTDEAVIRFINGIAALSGVGHEECADGLLIFKSVPKAAEGLPGTAPAIDPAPQPSEEVSVITEEPAPAPVQDGQAAAAAVASNGDAA